MGGKGPKEHTTTQQTGPPEWVQPYLEGALSDAQGLYQDQSLYPSTQLPQPAMQGFQGGLNVAANPALIDPAVGLAQDTIAGNYLGADALRDASRAELDDVIGGVRGGAERAGMSGSTGHDYALGRGVTAAMAPAYQRERALQQQAMGMAPGLEAARYMPSQQQIGLGMQQRGLEERYHQEPWDRLARYTSQMLGPAQLSGQQSLQSQPIYRQSPLQQGLGLGLTALGMFGGGGLF